MRKTEVALFALGLTALSVAATQPSQPAPAGVHLRGTVQSFRNGTLVVNSSSGPVKVQVAPSVMVMSVIPSSRSQVKEGSFLGIASVPGAGGAQRAREVVVFPEAARGAGEGSYDWDLPSGAKSSTSRMTNGTVSSRMTNGMVSKSRMTNGTVKGAGTSAVTLEFKNGSGKGTQKISLPQGIPFVTFVPGNRSQLTPGVHVVIFCHSSAKGMVADRVLVGKNGLVPPM